jgi:hypothetical protein
MNGRRLGGVVAAALGVGFALLLLLKPHDGQRDAPGAPAAAPAPERKAEAPKSKPQPPRRVALREKPAVPAELPKVAAALEPGAPPPQAASQPEEPNSVLGWGPWAGQHSPGPGGETPASSGATTASGVLPGVNVAANSDAQAPVVLPPPAASPDTRPGYGWGDRNHVHTRGR